MVRRAGMLAVGLVLLLCATAHAGTYEVWACAGPDGTPAPVDGWTAETTGIRTRIVNECASGGGLYAGVDGAVTQTANNAALTWHFKAPADTQIASFRIWRAVAVEPGVAGAQPAYTLNGDTNSLNDSYEGCYNGCPGLGSTTSPLADANVIAKARLVDTTNLHLNAYCGGDAGGTCPAATTAAPDMVSFRAYRAAVVLQDDSVPLFTSVPTGPLVAPGPISGTQSASFSVADTGSGVYQVSVEVDGRAVSARSLDCSLPFTTPVPCKLSTSATVALDTTAFADGPHAVRILLTDATQTNLAAFGPFSITVANAPAGCAAANAADVTSRLDRKSATIDYGGKVSVRGQAPPGAQIRVFSQVRQAAAAWRLVTTPLAADAKGRFTYRVPTGPSRALRFGYASGTAYQCSKPLTVSVRAPVSLSASPRAVRAGSSVRFSGKLRGGYRPSGGKLVELQAFERGHWRSIRTVRTDAKGAYRYRYRFSLSAGGATFPIRARVRREAGYPFALGTSTRVTVRVR